MKQVYWRAPKWKYNFRNTQRYSPLSSIHYVIEENLSVVAAECLTVLGTSICINEQAENYERKTIVKENYCERKLWYKKEKLRRSKVYHMAKIHK